jgi:hypothetical protein
MLYQVSKGPAQNLRHGPSMQQMKAAADAMVTLASNDSGVILVSSSSSTSKPSRHDFLWSVVGAKHQLHAACPVPACISHHRMSGQSAAACR